MDWILTPLFGNAMRAVLIVLILTVMTGGLHLDGLADTGDALGLDAIARACSKSCATAASAAFGTIALIFVIVLKVFAIAGSGGRSATRRSIWRRDWADGRWSR